MVTSAPLQTALITFSLISTTTHGSPAVFVPLYFQPFEPAGLPRPVHVPAVRLYVFVARSVDRVEELDGPGGHARRKREQGACRLRDELRELARLHDDRSSPGSPP